MVRKVFFSFHYEKDSWRVNVVRQSWLTKPNRRAAGYIDASDWEEVKKNGNEAIKKWISDNLSGTSVTVVLIGEETCKRPWVRYEIKKSYERGNGILGVYIHNIENQNNEKCECGGTDFGVIGTDKYGNDVHFNDLYQTYYWFGDKGYDNFGDWVEKAAKDAGR